MGNKSKYSLEERTSWVIKWQSSGMNKIEFCKEHNLNPNTFKHWNQLYNRSVDNSSRLGMDEEHPETHSPESFISVKLDNVFEPSGESPLMELKLSNGGILRFYQPVSADYIKELLK